MEVANCYQDGKWFCTNHLPSIAPVLLEPATLEEWKAATDPIAILRRIEALEKIIKDWSSGK
jgi:hypothetical protein